MNVFGDLLRRSRLAVIVVAAIGAAALLWGRGFVGRADGQATKKELVVSARSEQTGSIGTGEQSVDLSQKQVGSIKVGTLGTREFAILKTAVGTAHKPPAPQQRCGPDRGDDDHRQPRRSQQVSEHIHLDYLQRRWSIDEFL